MSLAIGIDLGTTNSVAAVATPTGVDFALGPRGERVHPSIVSFTEGGGIVVGAEARGRRVTDPDTTIYSAKRLIGQNIRSPLVQLALTALPFSVEEGINHQPIAVVRDRRLTMPEVSAQVLLHLKRCTERQMGDRVTQAVITVPANFSDAQRQATREAGRLAGLEVLRLINEPTAAALAYGFGHRLDDIVGVFDFGGGTFDVSLLKIKADIFEVLATDGDFFLGGDDIDRTIAEFLAAEMNRVLRVDPRANPRLMTRLAMAAEEFKHHLTEHLMAEGEIEGLDPGNGRPFSLPFRLTRLQMETMISGYVDRTIELCRHVMVAARLDPAAIGDILCVGGSTRIPLVRERIAELFGREPNMSINPDEVVAQGAAIQAGSLSGKLVLGTGMGERSALPSVGLSPLFNDGVARHYDSGTPLPRPLLLDVTPATLSIATAGGYTERLLEKNAPIPIERTKMFTTARDQQSRVVIDCCRGEAKKFLDNEPLGCLVLDELPARPRGQVRIEVTFRVDTDGILHVRARDADTGAKQEAMLAVIGAPVREVA
jgi:molecular chaperone DnaK